MMCPPDSGVVQSASECCLLHLQLSVADQLCPSPLSVNHDSKSSGSQYVAFYSCQTLSGMSGLPLIPIRSTYFCIYNTLLASFT